VVRMKGTDVGEKSEQGHARAVTVTDFEAFALLLRLSSVARAITAAAPATMGVQS